jgi:hypothetical protein
LVKWANRLDEYKCPPELPKAIYSAILVLCQCIFYSMEARIHHPCNDSEEQPRFLHISWLYAQDYCEYQLYLEKVKGITTEATVTGSNEYQRLEDEFLAKVDLEYTFEEAVEESKGTSISSRELFVEDRSLDIRWYIDELSILDGMSNKGWH